MESQRLCPPNVYACPGREGCALTTNNITRSKQNRPACSGHDYSRDRGIGQRRAYAQREICEERAKGRRLLPRATFEVGRGILCVRWANSPFGSCHSQAMVMPFRCTHRKALETCDFIETQYLQVSTKRHTPVHNPGQFAYHMR